MAGETNIPPDADAPATDGDANAISGATSREAPVASERATLWLIAIRPPLPRGNSPFVPQGGNRSAIDDVRIGENRQRSRFRARPQTNNDKFIVRTKRLPVATSTKRVRSMRVRDRSARKRPGRAEGVFADRAGIATTAPGRVVDGARRGRAIEPKGG